MRKFDSFWYKPELDLAVGVLLAVRVPEQDAQINATTPGIVNPLGPRPFWGPAPAHLLADSHHRHGGGYFFGAVITILSKPHQRITW